MNKRIVLASYPEGWVTDANFRLETAPMPKPAEGEVLVKNLWLSLDPYMRGRLSQAKSYVKGLEIGDVMTGETAGEVVESKHPRFKPGDKVTAPSGWQLYCCLKGDLLNKVDASRVPLSYLPRLPRHAGAHRVLRHEGHLPAEARRDGGGVGRFGRGGQRGRPAREGLGRARGRHCGRQGEMRLRGEGAGVRRLRRLQAGQPAARPEGSLPQAASTAISRTWAAQILDTVLAQMNVKSRIAVCGLISDYNAAEPYGVKMFRSILVNRIKVQGLIVFDWLERYPEGNKALQDLAAAGKLKTRESVLEGLEKAPQGLIGLLKGENFGKQLVKLYVRLQ